MFFHKQYEDFYIYIIFSPILYHFFFTLNQKQIPYHIKTANLLPQLLFCTADTKLSSSIGGKTMIILYLCTVFNLENK